MKYLLLIPSILAMLCSVFFYASAMLYRWEGRWTHPTAVLAGAGFQFAAVYIASLIDR